ncbi:phenylethanolamine N-methyltransferase [Pelobates fuscus]|uniref:phenylethanolamine N-methyltransferase n=1 Tax=Pelobates fuscus TaxID=191477 RepID=UPI002FE4A885
MSTIQTIAENYQSFNPRAYLQNNYIPPRADFDNPGSVVPWKLRCLADACASGEIGGQLMVDIGTGPTVYQLLSAFELFKEVVLTDYLEVNREEIRKWLRGEAGTFDWGPYIKHVCNIEGKGEPWEEKQNRLRARVSKVIPVDIHQPCPLGKELGPGSIDTLVSSFCLEACSPDYGAFKKALGNITRLLKPGGHFLMIGALEESFYLAGEAKLSVVSLTEEMTKKALCDAGYKIRDFRAYVMPQSMRTDVDDTKGIFFAWAQKETK